MAKKRVGNAQRTVESEVRSDKQAGNLLASASHNYKNQKDRPVVNSRKNRVYKKKTVEAQKAKASKRKPKIYDESQLKLPKLNKSIDPEGIKQAQRGKKRDKKYIESASSDKLKQIVAQVTQQVDSQFASKLEKSRQLEEIRELKRKEIEEKEQQKQVSLEKKKQEIKNKKKKKSAPQEPAKKKKSVSFA
ncbi:60S ribosomal subunit assembly/export protein Loc1p [Trichomonascus vanleenenianus]|uniref:60S ribosomal subunit assembly/export protein Loc1p n=1 Tax=Trichomonascus vanleenenianus TaxID=2268995 RepID=UPI003ECAA243